MFLSGMEGWGGGTWDLSAHTFPTSVPSPEMEDRPQREEYSVLADLPPPRRLAQREPGPQGSNGGRTRSPGRAEVERLFGQERR